MAAEMAFVRAQVCGASKEELLTAGQSVRERCEICFDEGVNCRVENHKSVPLGIVSLYMFFTVTSLPCIAYLPNLIRTSFNWIAVKFCSANCFDRSGEISGSVCSRRLIRLHFF